MKLYREFLQEKLERATPQGFEISPSELNPNFFDYQTAVAKWSVYQGNILGALAVGLGKTILQVSDAKVKQEQFGGKALFVAPLAVSHQTILEAEKLVDTKIIYVQSQDEVEKYPKDNFFITNQEHIIRYKFDHNAFNLLVLDEASKMLKAFRGKARNELTYRWGPVPHKTAWTATPAPNQLIEILNYAEFLGIKRTQNALTKWFDNDASKKGTESLTLKPLLEQDFWEWLASWCVAARKPSDLGFSDEGHELPDYEIIFEDCQTDQTRAFEQGVKVKSRGLKENWEQRRLIPETNLGATMVWGDKRETKTERAAKVAEIVNRKPDENWFILTDTNYERDEVNKYLSGCTVVSGEQSQAVKEAGLLGFARGEIPRLLTKPDIAGYGLNFQYHCNHMVLIGLTHRWEIIHQTIGRIVRPLQLNKCFIHVVLADSEVEILQAIDRKQRGYDKFQEKMNPAMRKTGVLSYGRKEQWELQDTPHDERMIIPKWLKDQEIERMQEYA